MSRYAPTSGELMKFREKTGMGVNEAFPIMIKKNMLSALEHSSPNMQVMQDVLIEMLKMELSGVRFPPEES